MNFKNIFAVTLLLSLVISCKKNDVEQETDNLFKFREYISYTTSGNISKAEPIVVNLATAVDGWEMGKELKNDIFAIQPHVQGKLTATSANAFTFKPDEYLKSDTEYTVSVKLNKIYKSMPKGFETYTFKFKTITPNFNIVTNHLQSYSKEWQYLEAELRAADIIALNDAKKLVEAWQNGKKLKLAWNEMEPNSKFFQFKIDSIHRVINDSEVLIKWDGKPINADNKGENTFAIPGINNFTIVNVEVVQVPEQYVSINFSDPLKKG